jgi:carbonic anhydrase
MSFTFSSALAQAPAQAPAAPAAINNPATFTTDWNVALQYLKAGNARYVNNQGMPRTTNAQDRETTKDSQKPFAVVLTCSDSRVAPEIYFDQKMGDIFVIRNAGNIADTTALGSLEFAVAALKAPLVVVVGHTQCGAVKGSLDPKATYPDNLQSVINQIRPNVKNFDAKNVPGATRANIDANVNRIRENAIVKQAGAHVIGALYDVATGVVTFN